MARALTIGSRGSQLALAQSHRVRELLLQCHPALVVVVQVIRTRGDQSRASLRSLGGQGLFTRELERALLEGCIDLAVHSLKDLPTEIHPELELVATPPREDVRDVLVARAARSLEELPQGARLGTGSLRRQVQLLALRPDLRPFELRGNVDTRLGKVERGECEGVVLAAAGLHRLGRKGAISAYLEPAQMLPAAGQGALGLQMHRASEFISRVKALDHPPTFAAVSAERSLLARLGGGCRAPIAAWARQEGEMLHLEGLIGAPGGRPLLRAALSGPAPESEALGARLAAELQSRGAGRILRRLASAAS